MNKNVIEKCDALLKDWMNGNSKKSENAWKKLLKDVK
jgi:hypothetical protein